MAPFRPRHLLVTGGAGFLGSAYVRTSLEADPTRLVTVLDRLAHAGNLANLEDLTDRTRVRFVAGDIADQRLVEHILAEGVDAVVNLATETSTEHSLPAAPRLIQTDVQGTCALLEACRHLPVLRFVQVSTGEVYGEPADGPLSEDAPLRPHSPSAASKAGGELLAQAYFHTYGLPVLITRGTATFGPRQHPGQLVPLAITHALCGEPIRVQVDETRVHDLLYVEDHAKAIETVLTRGMPGLAYNAGAGTRLSDREVVERVLALFGRSRRSILPVVEDSGHARRGALDSTRLGGLGWRPQHDFEAALAATVTWYREHQDWWRPLHVGYPIPFGGSGEVEPLAAIGGIR